MKQLAAIFFLACVASPLAAEEPAAEVRILDLLLQMANDGGLDYLVPPGLPELYKRVPVPAAGMEPADAFAHAAQQAGLVVSLIGPVHLVRRPITDPTHPGTALESRILEKKLPTLSAAERELAPLPDDAKTLRAALAAIATDFEVSAPEVLLAEAITTSRLSGMNVGDALRELADQVNARLVPVDATHARLRPSLRISIEQADLSVRQLLAQIDPGIPEDILVYSTPLLDQVYSVRVKDLFWDDVLDAMLQAAALVAIHEKDGQILRIVKPNFWQWNHLTKATEDGDATLVIYDIADLVGRGKLPYPSEKIAAQALAAEVYPENWEARRFYMKSRSGKLLAACSPSCHALLAERLGELRQELRSPAAPAPAGTADPEAETGQGDR